MSVSSAFERLAVSVIASEAAADDDSAMKPISVRLPEPLVLLIDNMARELHTSRSDVIQTILANGAEEAAATLADHFASDADRTAYFMSLHSPADWGPAPTEGSYN